MVDVPPYLAARHGAALFASATLMGAAAGVLANVAITLPSFFGGGSSPSPVSVLLAAGLVASVGASMRSVGRQLELVAVRRLARCDVTLSLVATMWATLVAFAGSSQMRV